MSLLVGLSGLPACALLPPAKPAAGDAMRVFAALRAAGARSLPLPRGTSRVVVSLWNPRSGAPRRLLWKGEGRFPGDLASGIQEARVQVDFGSSLRTSLLEDLDLDPGSAWDPSRDGLEVDFRGRRAAFVPSDLLTADLWRPDPGKRRQAILKRLLGDVGFRAAADPVTEASVHIFRVASFVEAADGRSALPLSRGTPAAPAVPTHDEALVAAGAGAGWLLDRIRPDGSFLYLYDALADRESEERNVVRHAGCAYALLQHARATGDPDVRDGGRRALAHLLARLRRERQGTADVAFLPRAPGEAAPLGAAALALLAIQEIPETERTPGERDAAAPLAAFLRWMQHPDGRFYRTREDRLSKGDPGEPALYFPGEALFALARRAAEGEAVSRDAARRAAARQIAEFREGADPDHWTMQGLGALARGAPAGDLLDPLAAMAARILEDQIGEEGLPDERGGFRTEDPPPLAHAATRLEGLGAARAALAAPGRPVAGIDEGIRRGLGFVLRLQASVDSSFFLPNPEKARSGFRASPLSAHMRIDHTQHAVSAILLGLDALPP